MRFRCIQIVQKGDSTVQRSPRRISGEKRMRQAEKRKYVHWYRLAQGALGDLAPHLGDSQIVEWVSEENWLFIPNYGERNREEAQNRPDPNIWFSLENGTITVGLVCNTL